ncbi:MAG: hypothetical protein ABIB97_02740 [Patescibacteria group bacterium]
MDKKPNWKPTKAEYWQYLPAPARPWPSEVAWFEKYALKKKEEGLKDVLILGSTVEFRAMLHKHKMNVHVVDFSKEFYETLSRQKMKFRREEVFYEQNWVTMDLGKKFDLIFGDWVPGVLYTKDYDKFYINIIKHLNNKGLFIGRECLRPNKNPVDLEKVAKEHYKKYASRYSFYETSAQYAYGFSPDPVTSMWNITKAQKALDDVYKKNLMEKDDFDFMTKALSFESDGSMSIMVKEDFEKEIKKYFNIFTVHHVEEPSSDWFPIYVLQKKGN